MRDMSYQPILVNGVLTPSFQLIEHIASSLTHNIHQFIVLTSKDTELLEDISSRSSRDLIYEQDLDFQSVIDGMKAQMAKDGYVDEGDASERLPAVVPRGEFFPERLSTYQDYVEGDVSEHEYITHAHVVESMKRGVYVIALHNDEAFFDGIEYPDNYVFNHYRIEKATEKST